MSDIHQQPLRIPADHPSLAGHFPGDPVVPGVVVVDHVLTAVESWLGPLPDALRLPQVKFMHSLLPGMDAVIELQRSGRLVRFRVLADDRLLASGDIELPA